METLPPLPPERRSLLPAAFGVLLVSALAAGAFLGLRKLVSRTEPGLPAPWPELERLVRRAGNAAVLPELARRLKEGLERAQEHEGSVVVAGRMRRADGGDPEEILAQFRVLPGGWFAGAVKDPRRGLLFRARGHAPFHLRALEGAGAFRLAGEHVLPVLAPEDAATLKGRVEKVEWLARMGGRDGTRPSMVAVVSSLSGDGAEPPPDVEATLRPAAHPLNGLDDGPEPRPRWPEPWRLALSSAGLFEQGGLGEGRYELTVRAPGLTAAPRTVNLLKGRRLDVGSIQLERERSLALTYLVSETRDFRGRVPQASEFKAGDRWVAGPVRQGWDLEFQQRGGLLSPAFAHGPVQWSVVGEGSLEDFLEKEVFEARMGFPSRAPLRTGWVYLVHQQAHGRWLLFRVDSQR